MSTVARGVRVESGKFFRASSARASIRDRDDGISKFLRAACCDRRREPGRMPRRGIAKVAQWLVDFCVMRKETDVCDLLVAFPVPFDAKRQNKRETGSGLAADARGVFFEDTGEQGVSRPVYIWEECRPRPVRHQNPGIVSDARLSLLGAHAAAADRAAASHLDRDLRGHDHRG